MDIRSILDQLTQLSEATKETGKGRVHTADPGGYGRKYDSDETGDEKTQKAPAVKRGRGRPRKGADNDGNVPKYDNAKALQSYIVGNIPKGGLPGKATTKHTLKDWINHVEKVLAEEQQLTMKPMANLSQLVNPKNQKVVATGPADKIKAMQSSIEKGEVTLPNQNTNRQGVAENSEWETRHTEFTTVGDRATPEQINKIVSALGVAAEQANGKRGFLNKFIGKHSNGDLARMAYTAETLAKNIQRNSNAKPGTDERKELGQHLVYAVSLLKRMNGGQGMTESEYKSRHIHQQQQNKKYDEYRRNQEAAGKKPLSRGDWAATQRKGLAEMDKSQTPPGRDGGREPAPAKKNMLQKQPHSKK